MQPCNLLILSSFKNKLHIGLTLIAIFGKILEADFQVFSFLSWREKWRGSRDGVTEASSLRVDGFFGLRLFDNP